MPVLNLTVNPDQLVRLMRAALPAGKQVLVAGPPGIGKTEIMIQAALSLDWDVIVSYSSVEDPTNSSGLPWFDDLNHKVTFFPFGQHERVLAAKKPTLWLNDDFGQALPAVQAANMPWLSAREVNGHRLPDCVTIAATTNRREDRSGVQGMFEAVKSRFDTIVTLAPEVKWTCRHFVERGDIPPMLIAFLDLRGNDTIGTDGKPKPGLLCNPNPSPDMVNFPCPRTWAKLGGWVNLGLDADLKRSVYCGTVGEAAGSDFLDFERIYKSVVSMDQILLNPATAPIPDRPGELWAIAACMGQKASPGNYGRIVTYVERLVDSGHAEYGVLALKTAEKRCPDLVKSPDFIRARHGKLGEMMLGQVS